MHKKMNLPEGHNNPPTSVERRKFPRLNINVNIKYSVIPSTDQQNVGSKNISAGGICVFAQENLKIGNKLKLEISLPDDPVTIQAIGQVVWTKSFSLAGESNVRYDAGVEFIEISDEEKQKIQKYIFRLS